MARPLDCGVDAVKFRIVVALIVTMVPGQLAFAQSFPSQSDICENGIVVKEKLAKAFLKADATWEGLYIDADAPSPDARYRPQWRRIYTDPNFCANNPGCLAKNPDKRANGKEVLDTTIAEKTLRTLRLSFAAALQTQTGPGRQYSIANFQVGSDYFLGDNNVNRMACVSGQWPQAAKPSPGISLPIRLRSSTDELYIDSADKAAFKGAKPAKITYTSDNSAGRTQTVTLIGALGYPIPLRFETIPTNLDYFTGELVPYVAANQTITKKQSMPSSSSASSYTAAGAVLDSHTIFSAMPGVNNVLSATPQYLWNSHDRSEIASVKAIYAPWTVNAAGMPPSSPKINTPFEPGGILGDSTLQLFFDLRYDLGYYTDRGDNPTTVAQHNSFSRGGTKVGFALVTPGTGPHSTLSITETMLYGFTGQVRQLYLFASEWDYYFDSTSNLALTVSYNVGRDEDTAEKVQLWTVGLAAKF
jgi:hypothetical protein